MMWLCCGDDVQPRTKVFVHPLPTPPMPWKEGEVRVRARAGERTTWFGHDSSVSDPHHISEASNHLYTVECAFAMLKDIKVVVKR